ncbi:IclR family transcriptional regulator [Pseudonocardia abyssalis]|uniref:IclR family transcriptional regulator n=1 Tax=Pseudonocardia abyssalis TaxID=2792008 RepID=A0ABS6URH7_9PSEU|nr:IclR family transcriptional regulator [Pseudonocardia abyssalis]MBW0114296.1 IclR family transcriptional regulator [Pseudonocardia abyssalis]MBW0134858.1 IclR family transcriptional regulator [Pseudonocardia abyssalis]
MPRVATGESVLSRAVRLFEVFGSNRRELTVTEIARRSGLHVATASRLIAELVRLELLTRTENGRVHIGMRMWELAQRASPALTLREAAMPYLEDLHAVVGHSVQLGVLDGQEVLFLERLAAPGAVVNITRIAGRLPLHASSSGMVLLAHGPAEVREKILFGALKRFTPYTVTDPRRLRQVLADVRRDGHVVNNGHIHVDATGVAVPVRDGAGTVVAALSAVVPNDGRAFAVVPVLKAAARGIGRSVAHGGRG